MHSLAWLIVVAMPGLLVWPWKAIETILLGILVVFLLAWSNWTGGAALFAAFMAALCGVGLVLTYRGERQDKDGVRLGGAPEHRPYPAWLRDQVLEARTPLTRSP